MRLYVKGVDGELGFEFGSVLLECVSVYAEVIVFEELDVPGGLGVGGHRFTLALSRPLWIPASAGMTVVLRGDLRLRGMTYGFGVGCVVLDSGVDVCFVAFSAFVAAGAVDYGVAVVELGVGAGEG